MCGVTGFWAQRPLGVPREEVIAAMTEVVRHRGPDGQGIWLNGDVAFGHRRLAIIDLSPTGHQPMVSASGRYTITFNGEVYNFAALRQQLEMAGTAPKWRGTSDTEVMLATIEAWGLEAAVQHFFGMFAFALWDSQTATLSLVRDRLGVKPLHFAQGPFGLSFGSELKSLQKFPGFDSTLDTSVLAEYLRSSCVPGDRCIFRGARKVDPGCVFSFTSASADPRVFRYWDAFASVRAGVNNILEDEEEAVAAVDRLIRDAVKLRMVSDVPLGAFLSGGVDSSTVVALMQDQSSQPIRTFSIANESALFDESKAAEAVAKHLGTQHTTFTVTPREALDVIQLLPGMFDEPFADSSQIPTYLVAKLARRDVVVALSGDGGDELFGGYTRHVWGPRIWSASHHLPRSIRTALGRLVASRSAAEWDGLFSKVGTVLPKVRLAGIRMHKLANVLSSATPVSMYELLVSQWTRADRVLLDAWPDKPAPARELPRQLTIAEYMMVQDLVSYLPDDVLTKVDRATMAASLEAREPLLDHRLLALAWTLPESLKIRGTKGKWILRQVLAKYVPPSLISSPKMGFGVPLGDWLRGPLRHWAEELLDESALRQEGVFHAAVVRRRWEECVAGKRPWEYHLWSILMFRAWRLANRT